MCNARRWSHQCWKSCVSASNIVALRFGDHGTKEILGGIDSKVTRFQILRNNYQQHVTICNRVCKRTQHVKPNNVGSCWPTMLRPFPWGFTNQSSLTSTGDISSILPIRSVKNSVMSFCSPVFSGCLSIVYVRQNVFGL